MIMSDQHNIQSNQQPWWNRSLFGKHTLREKFLSFFHKEPIIDGDIFVHDLNIRKLEEVTPSIIELDQEKFGDPEFILLLNIRSAFEQEEGENRNLGKSSEMLKAAIEAKDIFLMIEQIEFQHYSFAQQEFYQRIFQLLEQSITIKEDRKAIEKYQTYFSEQVEVLAQRAMEELTTEEGKTAIKSYAKQLYILASEHEVGLRLFYLFKLYELQDFSILQKISNLVPNLKRQDLHNLQRISLEVKRHYNLFIKLRKIIGIPSEQNNFETYTKMMQYIALLEKHKHSYGQFKRLIELLQVWLKFYEPVNILRDQYPSVSYRLPRTFRQKVPGLAVYRKYQSWLILSR